MEPSFLYFPLPSGRGQGEGGQGERVDAQAAPLAGITVVDLTSYIAGSYGAMMLADLGAHVIKVEALEGDSFRELQGFYGWNRGKRSIAVNLKTPDGRAVVHRLAERGDVVMENMRPGVVERLGVDYATLRALNPRIIYCSVTAFGSDGPYRDRPGFDPLIQAMSGVMTLQGFGGPPQYVRVPVTDYYAAALGCQAVLAALFVRERTGTGQRVETSLLKAGLALQSGSVVDYPGREIVYRDTPTYRLYQAGDGQWFFLACGNQSFWAKLCIALGRPDLVKDPRFGSWLARRDNADALTPLLEEAFASRPRDEWLRILAEHDIPAAPTQSTREFMKDPAVLHHNMIVSYEHPELGPLTLMGQPLRFSESRVADAGPPPVLGQHTAEVLREVGYRDEEIADLCRRGIVAGKDLPA
jgi:crotonobetainyl-CoA:carnitine CoA-transferase CaiB-like acyl-CoA transferase